jgi:hypothetical protein
MQMTKPESNHEPAQIEAESDQGQADRTGIESRQGRLNSNRIKARQTELELN